MRMFFDDRQRAHAPTQELHNGGFTTYAEMPARVDAILAALGPVETPADRGEAAILAVHSPAYVTFLKDAARLWREAGRTGDAIPYAFPIRGRRPLDLTRIDALIGAHSFDATTPITPDSWAASYGSAQSALAATQAVLEGDRAAFALCRPPGHHAGADYCGGYCHLNTAAIAAQAARDAGVARVAILDIDYHHGNGTQDIFYERGDVFYASVHADPRTDYPFFWGTATVAVRRSTCLCPTARRSTRFARRRRPRSTRSRRSIPGCSSSASARIRGRGIRSRTSR
jgi:acetoin utilization deacetylase AcuC-like enzyme